MRIWTSAVLSMSMAFTLSQLHVLAKGGHGKGGSVGHSDAPRVANNPRSNGNGTTDRDFGQDRAREVGKGKKKGHYKSQYSIADQRDNKHDKNKDKNKKVERQHEHKKDKDRNDK